MTKLLGEDTFDAFLMEKALVQMAVTWEADGHLNEKFYDPETWKDPSSRPYDLVEWKAVRPQIYNIIRGRQTPAGFHFVLHLKPEIQKGMLERLGTPELSSFISAFLINIRYSEGHVRIVTGTSYKSFTLDKSADKFWDKTFIRFLTGKAIDYEPMQQ